MLQTTSNQSTETRKRNIFDISSELEQIAMAFDQLADTGEESEVLAALENYFGDLLNERDKKIDGYCYLIAEYLAKATARKAEAARILAIAKTDENNAKRLKDRLKIYFEANGIKNLETKFHKLGIAGNGGVQPLTISSDVEDDPKNTLPEEFLKIIFEPNKEAIRAELAKPEDEQNPTVRQHCVLEPRGTSLRIK